MKPALCVYMIKILNSLLPLLILLCPFSEVFGQEAHYTGLRNKPIPHNYKTWSLFLINNPNWLLSENSSNIRMLHERFKIFGDVIGPDHLAVWFGYELTELREYNSQQRLEMEITISRHSERNPLYNLYEYHENPNNLNAFQYYNLDLKRSSAFCSILKLPPSKGPYIVITDQYPGAGLMRYYPRTFNIVENYSIIELNNATPSEITDIISKLADSLIKIGLADIDPKTEKFWRVLQKSYESIRDELVKLSKKIEITISTGFFKLRLVLNGSS